MAPDLAPPLQPQDSLPTVRMMRTLTDFSDTDSELDLDAPASPVWTTDSDEQFDDSFLVLPERPPRSEVQQREYRRMCKQITFLHMHQDVRINQLAREKHTIALQAAVQPELLTEYSLWRPARTDVSMQAIRFGAVIPP